MVESLTEKDRLEPWSAAVWGLVCGLACVVSHICGDLKTALLLAFGTGMWAEDFCSRMRNKYPESGT